jgi:hypothetical protein
MASNTPNIFVHEYISGGGWPDPELPTGLAAEGLAMLRAVLADFRTWGGGNITTTRDRRLAGVSLLADRVIDIDPQDHYTVLCQLAKQCTAALIIAPESDAILSRLSALMESEGACLLGSSPDSVATAGNKWDCHRLFIQAGLPTPATWRVNLERARETAEKVVFPLVIKPVDGVGCEAVSLVSDISSLNLVLEQKNFQHRDFLLQRYIAGTHASVSMLVSENSALLLSLNEQLISIGIPFVYQGGIVPLQHPQQRRALNLARRAVSLVPGLKGYVGVDMVLTDEECYLIEINPRLTTSYIGLRQVININLAEAIWRTCRENFSPQKIIISGKVLFNKEELGVI